MKKTILSLAAVSSIMAATTVTASAHENVTVKKGDTLFSIAQKNGVSVSDIKQANNLTSNLIFPQQELKLHGDSSNASASSSDQGNASTYTIRKGDTLYSIAQKHGTSVSSLKAANGLNSDLIYPGQKLSLNGESKATQQSTSQAQNNNAGTYTVRSGDTLYSIATQNGLSVASLKAANGLSSNIIQPGQQLSLNGEAKATTTQSTSEAESTSSSQDSSQVEGRTLTVEATAYTAFCSGCSGVTATGIDLRANPNQKVIAVDPDVIPLGSEVYVEGYGRAVAGDTGGAIQGNRIDVFMPDRSNALDFGRQSVEVTILN
ncbi:LysM peptidoglycan-binding and 3D domain-containing protein [Halobacillus salinus]|uniref:LysM peptidoglycan-binding and 3D domain-containing protein n=1 Tax=Halobacillus salinus TaxID=192814 RepID=UPI0009A66476|nr:LysM peptidoglycan-binding and 3D domain-containing protein [Halobacillus salinus]